MTDSKYYDPLEVRSQDERETDLMASLTVQVRYARDNTSAYAKVLADVDPLQYNSREALATLPVTRKSEMLSLQGEAPPFGGYAPDGWSHLAHVFQSPGPVYEPAGRRSDYWRLARALYAAGFRRGNLVHNAFAYHMTPAGSMLESGAHALGCAVFPAGTGQTEQQLQAMAHLKPHGYTGTPSFLKILLDRAADAGVDVTGLNRALVSGEALPPSLREDLEGLGVNTSQCYATADAGLISYESEAREGMIVDEQVILEIVRPGSGDPLPDGEVGEVVVTVINPDYPLIRFATGDMSAILSGTSPCGRTNARIKGWMGRADQTTKVKGMFVHPSQVNRVAAKHREINRWRLVVDRDGAVDIMTLQIEAPGADPGIVEAVAATLREECKLRGSVVIVDAGTLDNDGKVIDDIRDYS